MEKRLILIGGGGHCKSCIDVIEAEGKYIIEGILDAEDKVGTSVLNYPVVGTDENLDEYIQKGYFFLITVGQIKSAHIRKRLYHLLVEKKAALATVISPTALVSRYAAIGEGTIVMHRVNVNAGATIGNNVILNTGSLVEHDAFVGDHVHVSTHAVLNGGAVVEDDCFIGSNAVVAQEVKVGKQIIIGAGAVVISTITQLGIYVGSPAKMITK